MTETAHLEFESGPFLHSLFGEEPAALARAEAVLGVAATVRGGQLRLHGPPERVAAARLFFEQLENARRATGAIDRHGFRLALDAFQAASGTGAPDAAGDPVGRAFATRLAAGGGRPGVRPRNLRQGEFVRAMERSHVVFGLGPAGTGKTYLAVARAVDAIRRGEFRKLVLTRPAVEAGEALGFLPGDLKEKILPYLRPLYDALYDILGADEVDRMLERGMVEIAPLAYMRGRTLNHAYIILDEAQNTTREQMFMFLTRLGEESRCVVTGDPSQVDLRPPARSGLVEARRILGNIEGVEFIEFGQADVVRHPVVQRIIEAYEAHRGRDSEASP
jgi:phosphate starvation-inducible protein PhoH and related proteins